MIHKETIIGDCRLLLGDCMQIISMLDKIDAVVTDPPYGIGMDGGNIGYKGYNNFKKLDWDKSPPSDKFFQWLINNDYPYIVWGGNYFNLPPARCYLVWDKGAGFKGRTYAESELAITNLDANARTFTRDPLARGDYRGKQHPTQKPVPLMKWCLGFVPDAETILDSYMGSGTTGVACAKLGRKFIGIELDPEYYEVACERIRKAYEQPDLFISPPKTLTQSQMFED